MTTAVKFNIKFSAKNILMVLVVLALLAGVCQAIGAPKNPGQENNNPCVDGLVVEIVGISGTFYYTDALGFQGMQGPPDKNQGTKIIVLGIDGKTHQYFLPWMFGPRWNPEESYSWVCESLPGVSF